MPVSKSDLQQFIRSNGSVWPGCYPTALLMSDGECIDAQAAKEHYRAIRRGNDGGWRAEAVFVHWEGEPLECAHSGRMIESAYGVPE